MPIRVTVEELIFIIKRGDHAGAARVFAEMKMAYEDAVTMAERMKVQRDGAYRALEKLQSLMPKLRATLQRLRKDHGLN
jgi:hypothetical protein